MATIDIGKIKPVFKGTYDNSTAYVLDDIVYYNGSSYVAKTSTTGNLPTDATKWNILASGSGGIWDSTLSLGSAGQQLQVNSGATALEFATISGGTIKQIKLSPLGGTQYSHNSQSYNDVGAEFQLTITPTASSNKILLWTQVAPQMSNQGRCYYTFNKAGDSSGNGDLVGSNGIANAENVTQHGNGWLSFFYMDTANSTNALTYKLRQKTSNSTNLATSVAQDYNLMMAIELEQSKVS